MAQQRYGRRRRSERSERSESMPNEAADRMQSPETGDDDDPTVGPNEPSTTSAVNKQILDAVQASTEYAFGLNNELQTSDGTKRLSAGVAIAYDKAAQAAALGVQDATDYERNVLSIASAAQGKALAMILANDNPGQATTAFVLALISSIVAPIVVLEVGAAQTHMLNSFPQG